MVIINTKAVEVSIQAVSPELILSVPINVGSVGPAGAAPSAAAGVADSAAAGAGAWTADGVVAGVSSAHAPEMENVSNPSTTNRNNLVINANPLLVLDCARVAFIRPNTHDLHEFGHKNLSITDFAGLGRVDDCLDDLVGQGIHDGDFNFCLGYELDGIFGTPVDFGVTTLPTEAANVGNGDALHAHVAYCLANVIELERFDNRGN
jgi:hypothetical protein